jgi:3(or 17)beta-hydroxysteroid dehydrogenase
MSRVDGKVALVSESGQGIGAKTAQVLADAGATVVVSDINEENGESVVAQIKGAGREAVFQGLDVTQEADWKEAMERSCSDFGGLDVLVNNAGVELVKPIAALTLEDWRWITSINLDGVFLGTKGGFSGQTGGVCPHERGAGDGWTPRKICFEIPIHRILPTISRDMLGSSISL